jgi:hypothetical protein
VNAQVTTNSTNWSLGEYDTAALPTGATLCAFGNGLTFPAATLTSAPATQSGRTTYTDNTTCAAGGGNVALTTTASSTNLVTSATAYTASPANVGEDMGLMLTPAAATGAQAPTVTYSLVAN